LLRYGDGGTSERTEIPKIDDVLDFGCIEKERDRTFAANRSLECPIEVASAARTLYVRVGLCDLCRRRVGPSIA
jgi:hypothetical protein